MYTQKFEADTLEQALKDIKSQLGPDAIILKTKTNKGLKTGFGKKKIEITAAISEKSYVKKAKVDKILNQQQKEEFYSAPSDHISKYVSSDGPYENPTPSGYGSLGINRAVKQTKEKIKNSLDDFLGSEKTRAISQSTKEAKIEHFIENERAETNQKTAVSVPNFNDKLLAEQQQRIDQLERMIYEMGEYREEARQEGPAGLIQLRETLKSLDISERYIQNLLKKAKFEFSEEELLEEDLLFDFALREMNDSICTRLPKYSDLQAEGKSTLTILLSDGASGQTSLFYKLGALKNDSLLVQYDPRATEEKSSFTEKLFGLKVEVVKSLSEIISICRKAVESQKNVIVDFKCKNNDIQETKKFIEGMRRGFERVDFLLCLSAIHSEIYNNKVVKKYGRHVDALCVSHIDWCLDFGSLFNLQYHNTNLPFVFFGTGEVVPDDIESATSERLLSGMFDLES